MLIPISRRERLTGMFTAVFGREPEAVYSVPGRTELGGNHTDHQRGRVLAAAVDADMLAAAAENGSSAVRVYSEGMEPFAVDLSALDARIDERFTSAALVRGVAAGLRDAGLEVRGTDIAVVSGVPVGSGLSSSACFEVLCALVLSRGLLGQEMLAHIARRAENEYFGKPCGLMDQLACALGGTAAIDFGPDEPGIERLTLDLDGYGYALYLVYCGAGHENLTEEYAAIEQEMRSVAEHMGVHVLGEARESDFYAAVPQLRRAAGDRAVLRAAHFFAESRRAALEAEAIRAGDFGVFLSLVRDSGRSSAMYLQNLAVPGSASQPLLLAQAVCEHALDGRGAVRVHGGGFGGAVQCFVPADMAEDFAASVLPFEAVRLRLRGEGAVRVE